jgi:TRAP-type C4-dicarboxylate transport system substrate-binding protein
VDGEENPLPTIQASKFNEVQKFLVLTAHIMTPRPIMINERTWIALDAKQQGLLKAAVAKHAHEQDDEIVMQDAGLAETFAKGGMTVITPDLESFRKPVVAVLPGRFEAKWGKGLWDKFLAA